MLEDPGKDGKIKNALKFKGTDIKTLPLFMFTKKKINFIQYGPTHTFLFLSLNDNFDLCQ
jgi:hypothetical protein